MKKQWFTLPLVFALSAVIYAQAVDEGQTEGVQAEEVMANDTVTEVQGFVATVGYTYVKDNVTYASPMAQFDVQGVDAQSGLDRILVSVDNGEFAPYKGPISFVSEGAHSLAYRFIDKVGNISDSGVMNIYVDASAVRVLEPVFTPGLYVASGRNYIGLKNQISFKYFDDVTGVAYLEYAADTNALVRYSQPFTPEVLGLTNSGAFILNYQATDMVSNVTALNQLSLYLDAAAPTVNIFAKVYEVNGIKYISPKDVIQVEAFDLDTKVKDIMYAVNDSEYTNYDPAIGIRITTPGEYDIKAKASDIVGNVSAEVVYSVVVDGLAPKGQAAYVGVLGANGAAMNSTNDNVMPDAGVATPLPDMPNTPMTEEDAVEPVITDTNAPTNNSQEVPAGTTAPAAN